jgi:carboxypeptidase family protein/TonB-dependent receptor-like protein
MVPQAAAERVIMRRGLTGLAESIVRRGGVVLCALAVSALPSLAQGVGAIGGTVMDATGAVLPGVTVTLSSAQRTVGSNQETVTDARGNYEFLRLVPGTYSVRAQLAGFRPGGQPKVTVDTDSTARADLRLELGSLEQGITVTADAAPALDTTTAFKQTVIDRQQLEALPNRTDVWAMAKIVPSIVMGNIDVGGDQRFFQAFPSARGSNSENKILIDGMDVSSMTASGTTAMMYPDPFAFEQASIQVGAPSAEYSAGGVTYNMVTRSGTNRFQGGAIINGTTPSLAESHNYSPALYAQLLSGIPAKVLAANPGIQPNADIRKMTDAGAWLGGPIVRDRLWFVGTWRDQRLAQYTIGNYNADGTEVLDNDIIWTTSGKVSWQVNKNTQLSYFNNTQYKLQGHRSPGSGFFDNNASIYNYKYPTVNQAKFTSVLSSSLLVDVTYSRLRASDTFNPQPGVLPGTIATFDSTTQISGNAQPSYNINDHHRNSIRASLNWIKGGHDIKAGYEYQRNSLAVTLWSTSGLRANFASGSPVSVNTYVVAVTQSADAGAGAISPEYAYVENIHDFYIEDKWAPLRKLTLNVGLRYELEGSDQAPTCEPANQFYAGGLCFGQVTAPSFKNVAPRFNLVYDLTGDGKTALKLTANRYLQPIGSSMIQRLNPLAGGNNAGQATIVSDTRQWLPQSSCNKAGVLGCDRNGDGVPQANELGPPPGYVFQGVNASYSPGIQRPVSYEFTAEFQRQLPQGVVLSAVLVRKETRNNIGSLNPAAPPSSWIGPIAVTEVTSGQAVQVWKRGTSASAFLNYNSSDLDLNYNGVDLTLNKRMSGRWSMTGGASFGRARVASLGGNRSDPNITNNPFDSTGLPASDAPWSYRVSGVYVLPYQISVSGTGQYQIGAPETTTVVVTNQTISLPQGSQSVIVAPIGSVRLPNIRQLDLDVRRPFRLGQSGRTILAPRLEFFNGTNNATITGWVSQLGPTYHTPSSIQRGRLIKMELAVEF